MEKGKLQAARPAEFDGFFYELKSDVTRPWEEPIEVEESPAQRILHDLGTWSFERQSIDPLLVLGWMATGFMGGALKWRPVIFTTGDAGVGKSMLQQLIKSVLRGSLLDTTDTTQAGIYQRVRNDSLPVMVDELENKPGSERAMMIVELARIAASGGTLLDVDLQLEEQALRHREVAEKLAELTATWSERATPGGTPNAQSFATGGAVRGTFIGEVADFALQFKSFGLSFTTLQIEAMQQITAMQSGGKKSAAGYGMAMVASLMVGGAMSTQIKSLLDGKDLEDMSPDNVQFWFRSMMTGGGFGLFLATSSIPRPAASARALPAR